MITPQKLVADCKEKGISISTRGQVVTLHKTFPKGDKDEYSKAESDCSIIYDIPYSCGSIWGTDGGSIGGMVGLQGGYMTLNKSGVKKRFINELNKLI